MKANLIWDIFLDLFFLSLCLSCEIVIAKTDFGICADCHLQINIHDTLWCAICQARLANNEMICHEKAPCILAAASDYENPVIQNLIWQLKYQHRFSAAEIFGEILFRYYKTLELDWSGFTIVPIPIYKARERRRGYNQALLLAKEFSQHTNLPMAENLLIKIKSTQPQTEIKSWDERKKNIKGVFSASKSAPKKIILIDDVSTSGATLKEASEILKSAGAKEIIGLVVARAR